MFGLGWRAFFFARKSIRKTAMQIWDISVPKQKAVSHFDSFNTIEMRRSETPSSFMCASARALAKLAGAMAEEGEIDGKKILSKEVYRHMMDDSDIKMEPYMDLALNFT
jgi:hypothetical protein